MEKEEKLERADELAQYDELEQEDRLEQKDGIEQDVALQKNNEPEQLDKLQMEDELEQQDGLEQDDEPFKQINFDPMDQSLQLKCVRDAKIIAQHLIITLCHPGVVKSVAGSVKENSTTVSEAADYV